MADWYVSSVGYAAVAPWSALEAGITVAPATFRRPTAPAAGNERVYRASAITTGITGGAEPAWPLGLNGTVVDGGVTWTECTGQSTYQSAGNWTAPAASVNLIFIAGGRGVVAGTDNVYVADDHVETWASTRTWTLPQRTVCVTVAGSALPPEAASLSTGAVIATTGSASIGIGATGYFYGITFNLGTGAVASYLSMGTVASPGVMTFERCAIALNTTAAAARLSMGTTNVVSHIVLINTTVSFGHASQGIEAFTATSTFGWYDTPTNAVQGVSPTNLIIQGAFLLVEIINVDLGNLTGNIIQTAAGSNVFIGHIVVSGCRLNAATVLASNLRTRTPACRMILANSDSATGANIAGATYGSPAASTGIRSNTALYRDGGANAGSGNPYSWVIGASSQTNGAPTWQAHPITPPILFWNTTISVPRTITVHGLANKTALPTNLVVFLEAQYLGSSAAPQVSAESGGAGPLAPAAATATTATTENWADGGTPRSDNQVISTLGTARVVASNPGRVFFCTTIGTTAGSEPAGYAAAVDGGSVTDGTAIFRAGWRFSMSLTVTPEMEGWLGAVVHDVDSQSVVTDIYIDPLAVVT